MDLLKERIVAFFVSMLSPDLITDFVETVKGWLDGLIDSVEDAIIESENKIDDMALPILRNLRDALNIPDNDGEVEPAPEPEVKPVDPYDITE